MSYYQYKDNRPWVVYLIKDNTINKYYVGITCNALRRIVEHHLPIPDWDIDMPAPKYGTNSYLLAAFEEQHDMEYTWLEAGLTRSQARTAEIYWIQTLKNIGYTLMNKTCGGLYDKDPSVKWVNISNYEERIPLPLNTIQQMLQNPDAVALIKGLEVDEPNIVQLTLYKQYRR